MKIIIRNKLYGNFVAWAYDNKPSGGVICVKTKDRTVYFPLDTTSLTSQHKLRVMHKGKEYGLLCNFYL